MKRSWIMCRKPPRTQKKAPRTRVVAKTRSLARLKKQLDTVFSRYIRLKYSKNGSVACYTCGKIRKVEQMHCGHFVSRTYLATRWDENNCRAQCPGCNLFGNGKPLDFEENLKNEIGDVAVEALKKKRHEITKLDAMWYLEQIEIYQQKGVRLSTGSIRKDIDLTA